MKRATRAVLGAVVLACFTGLHVCAKLNLDDKSTLESRIAFELSTILDKFLGAEKSHVTVFVDAEAESIGNSVPDGKKGENSSFSSKKGRGALQQWLWKDMARKPKVSVMPGFMLPQEVTVTEVVRSDSNREDAKTKEAKEENRNSDPPAVIRIRRVVISVVLDRSVSDQDLEKVKVLAAEILGLNPERGDVLNVYRLAFVPWWKQLFTNAALFERLLPFLLWGLMIVGVILLVSFLAQRLFERWLGLSHPGREVSVVKNAPGSVQAADGTSVEGGAPVAKGRGKGKEEAAEKPEEVKPLPGLHAPFSYINPQNIERLATLLQEQGYPTSSMAVVLGFLPLDLRSTLLRHLDINLQGEVIQLMCSMHKVSPEMLHKFDAQLKEAIEHSYGGMVDTVEWMEAMPSAQCEEYLGFLEKVEPQRANAIRDRLIRFEDLLILPADQLPILVHSVAVMEWGVALAGIGPEGDSVLAIMPEESRNVVNQRLEMEHPAPETVLQVRAKILAQARELARHGRLKLEAGRRSSRPVPSAMPSTEDRVPEKLPPSLLPPQPPPSQLV